MLRISCHFIPLKPLTLRMNHAKLLDVLTFTSRKPCNITSCRVVATSRPANHAICSFIDSSGYASGPIRRCLFIDFIIKTIIEFDEHITVLNNNVTKFHKILIKKNRLRERTSFKNGEFS